MRAALEAKEAYAMSERQLRELTAINKLTGAVFDFTDNETTSGLAIVALMDMIGGRLDILINEIEAAHRYD
jgi:hypothetical protein